MSKIYVGKTLTDNLCRNNNNIEIQKEYRMRNAKRDRNIGKRERISVNGRMSVSATMSVRRQIIYSLFF